MKSETSIRALFVDIGGVLLTNGWDHQARQRAASKFDLDLEAMNTRHHLTFDTYEVGKLSLDDYLERVVFYEKRPFTREEFRAFMLAQSQPYPLMIELVRNLKARWGLKVAAISNEGRELTEFRIQKFGLDGFLDFFVSSCFVHYRKPDADIYRMALDIAQVPVGEVAYLEDQPMFVQVAAALGMRGICHTDYESTRKALAAVGLTPAV